MSADEATELVSPTQVREGDVIQDEVGKRWLAVKDIRMISEADGGVYSFDGDGPDDRVTFEGHDRVRRKKQ
ncbi:MAG: hypothetical protein JWO57_2063 [Pseudonocardiales bacterium]|nr:hypothetical protein [Pseudonocardiales bacterium]